MTAREWKAQNAERPLSLEEERVLDAVQTFHSFLQGVVPKGYTVTPFKKMNAKQAFTVIWFLQEGCHLLPDQYEMCDNCESIFDSYSCGTYDEKAGKHYCDSCDSHAEGEGA